MKTQELIVELKRLADLHPDADLRIEFVDQAGKKGPTTRVAGFVFAKVDEDTPTLRLTDEMFVEDEKQRCA